MKKDCVVIFDLDGTLLNTDELIKRSFEYVFKRYRPDYTLSEEEYLSFLGPKLRDSFARYFPEEMLDELVDCYRDYNHVHHEDFVTVYPSVIETLVYLKKQGYPLAVLTTKFYEAALIGLDLFDMTKYFDMIIGSNQIEKGKPDPLGIHLPLAVLTTKFYEAALIGLDLFDMTKYFDMIIGSNQIEKGKPDPLGIHLIMDKVNCHKAVMIGDNDTDILTGKNAHVYTVGVKWTPKGTKEMEKLDPDLMVDQMSEIIQFIERIDE